MIFAESLENVFSWSSIQIGSVFASRGDQGIKTIKHKTCIKLLNHLSISRISMSIFIWTASLKKSQLLLNPPFVGFHLGVVTNWGGSVFFLRWKSFGPITFPPVHPKPINSSQQWAFCFDMFLTTSLREWFISISWFMASHGFSVFACWLKLLNALRTSLLVVVITPRWFQLVSGMFPRKYAEMMKFLVRPFWSSSG